MKIIIDTHIFLWLADGNLELIKPKHLEFLKDLSNEVFLSTLSIAEIFIKITIGKLKVDGDIVNVINDMNLEILDFDLKSVLSLKDLPLYHRDPFDRMIISQAIANNCKILTYDEKFKKYNCKLL